MNNNTPFGVTPRSVHPSIRNVLEIPETPPPRPPPNGTYSSNAVRRVGVANGVGVRGQRRLRRTPGPPPPPSGFVDDISDSDTGSAQQRGAEEGEDDIPIGRVLYRLRRLPGVVFPGKGSLQDTVLRSMARNWTWHLDYDGTFLAELPARMKVLLLSYVGVYYYGRDQDRAQQVGNGKKHMRGLWPLFLKPEESEEDEQQQLLLLEMNDEEEVTRLDLTGAIGRSASLRQLTSELVVSRQRQHCSNNHKAAKTPSSLTRSSKDYVPSSWDEEAELDSDSNTPTPALAKTPAQPLRFSNLRFLSLAHPDPASANWSSLLNLLSHLSTITHLSLAHWPVPTLAPSSTHRPRKKYLLSNPDAYSSETKDWSEASRVLKRLSRTTYCLKWLDLEGCGEWFSALTWDGRSPNPNPDPDLDPHGGDGNGEVIYTNPGPEWNGSWRDVEWVGLGPGFIPSLEPEPALQDHQEQKDPSAITGGNSITTTSGGIDWTRLTTFEDALRAERDRRIHETQMEAFRAVLRQARAVERHILRVRREAGGKWVRCEFGCGEDGDGEERELVRRVLEEV